MRSWTKYIVILTVAALGGTLFYNKVYIPKTTFETKNPTLGSLNVTVRGIGNLSAKNIYSITAQTGGKIEKIFTDEGKWVKKGDLLITIDSVDMPILLDEAKLALKKAGYEIEASKNSLESLEAQKVLLQTTYNRYEKLLKQGFASKAEYDKAKSDLDSLDAQMNVSKSQIASAKAESLRLKKSIEAIEAKLQRLSVYAPVDGYVISKDAEEAQSVLSSTVILKIVDPKTLLVKTHIDERISNQIKVMQKTSIALRSEPKKPFNGYVQRIVAMSDAVTLEREIEVAFETIPTPFYINEQAEVVIEVDNYENVLKIPLGFIYDKNGKQGVWINKENRAHFQEISILAQSDEEAAVSLGVDIETQLLIPNSSKKPLSEGMKIRR